MLEDVSKIVLLKQFCVTDSYTPHLFCHPIRWRRTVGE